METPVKQAPLQLTAATGAAAPGTVLLQERESFTWRRVCTLCFLFSGASLGFLVVSRPAPWFHYTGRNTQGISFYGWLDGNDSDGSIPQPPGITGTLSWAAIGLDAASCVAPTAVLALALWRVVDGVRSGPITFPVRRFFWLSLLLRLSSIGLSLWVIWAMERSFRGHASWTTKELGWQCAVTSVSCSIVAALLLAFLSWKEVWRDSRGTTAEVLISPGGAGAGGKTALRTIGSPVGNHGIGPGLDGRLYGKAPTKVPMPMMASPLSPRGIGAGATAAALSPGGTRGGTISSPLPLSPSSAGLSPRTSLRGAAGTSRGEAASAAQVAGGRQLQGVVPTGREGAAGEGSQQARGSSSSSAAAAAVYSFI